MLTVADGEDDSRFDVLGSVLIRYSNAAHTSPLQKSAKVTKKYFLGSRASTQEFHGCIYKHRRHGADLSFTHEVQLAYVRITIWASSDVRGTYYQA